MQRPFVDPGNVYLRRQTPRLWPRNVLVRVSSFGLAGSVRKDTFDDGIQDGSSIRTDQAIGAGRVIHPDPVWAVVGVEVLAPVFVETTAPAHDVLAIAGNAQPRSKGSTPRSMKGRIERGGEINTLPAGV